MISYLQIFIEAHPGKKSETYDALLAALWFWLHASRCLKCVPADMAKCVFSPLWSCDTLKGISGVLTPQSAAEVSKALHSFNEHQHALA